MIDRMPPRPTAPADRGMCRSCNALVWWAVSATTGRRMPVDLEPDAEHGTIRLEKGVAHVLSRAELEVLKQARGQPTLELELKALPVRADELYTSHFATCRNANQHRRRRR